jgi:hypothetical protein
MAQFVTNVLFTTLPSSFPVLVSQLVGFAKPLLSVGIDNYTPYWIYLRDADSYIPPYWVGAIRSLVHTSQYAYAEVKDPFGAPAVPNIVDPAYFAHFVWTDTAEGYASGSAIGGVANTPTPPIVVTISNPCCPGDTFPVNACRATQTADQDYNDGSFDKYLIDHFDFNTGTFTLSGNGVVIPVTGYYRCSAAIQWDYVGVLAAFYVFTELVSAMQGRLLSNQLSAAAGSGLGVSIGPTSRIYYLSAGDILTMNSAQLSGVKLTVAGTNQGPPNYGIDVEYLP